MHDDISNARVREEGNQAIVHFIGEANFLGQIPADAACRNNNLSPIDE